MTFLYFSGVSAVIAIPFHHMEFSRYVGPIVMSLATICPSLTSIICNCRDRRKHFQLKFSARAPHPLPVMNNKNRRTDYYYRNID